MTAARGFGRVGPAFVPLLALAALCITVSTVDSFDEGLAFSHIISLALVGIGWLIWQLAALINNLARERWLRALASICSFAIAWPVAHTCLQSGDAVHVSMLAPYYIARHHWLGETHFDWIEDEGTPRIVAYDPPECAQATSCAGSRLVGRFYLVHASR